jgi:uncharacterized protein (TIGR02611 family)
MLKYARRIAVLIIGMTVLLIGIAMIVLPGPALVVIPVALAILATEFVWARKWLKFLNESADKGVDKLGLRPFLMRYLPFLFRKKDNQEPPQGTHQT